MNKILYLSLVDWYWIKQRPQHFAEILSNNNLVTYVCTINWRKDPNIRKHGVEDNNLNKSAFYLNRNLNIIRKTTIPKQNKFKLIKKLNKKIFNNLLLKLDSKNNYDIIYITHPDQYSKIPKKLFKDKKIVYDCMDNYLEFNNVNKKHILDNENAIFELCDHVIVSSGNLYQKLVERNSNISNKISIINNGVDITKFNLEKIINNNVRIIQKNTNIKVGYIGTISCWIDLDLIKKTALHNKNIDFYFIGPIDDGIDMDSINGVSNIIFTGTQPYSTIPNILYDLDITIMPFLKTELIYSVNPVKIYEYLALGKPVVALKYGETEAFGDLIYTYDSDSEFEIKLHDAINEDKNKRFGRIEFANKNSWKNRVENLIEILEK